MGPPPPSRRAHCEGIVCRKRVGMRPPQDEAEDRPSTTPQGPANRPSDVRTLCNAATNQARVESLRTKTEASRFPPAATNPVGGKLFFVRGVGTTETGDSSGCATR